MRSITIALIYVGFAMAENNSGSLDGGLQAGKIFKMNNNSLRIQSSLETLNLQ